LKFFFVLKFKNSKKLEGPCVLQLIKIRNIAAPKENETSGAAPPMFRLTLTDGTISLNSLVIDHDNNKQLNLNIPPGTKILIKNTVKIKSNLLILNNQTYQILGGNVQYLVEKWKTNRELQQHVRVVSAMAAAPPWVPFGVRQINQVDTSKKVFSQNEKQEEDSTSDFSQARQAALAEAMEAKLKITKTFTQQVY
jgi:tudor domain-containing protein 3